MSVSLAAGQWQSIVLKSLLRTSSTSGIRSAFVTAHEPNESTNLTRTPEHGQYRQRMRQLGWMLWVYAFDVRDVE